MTKPSELCYLGPHHVHSFVCHISWISMATRSVVSMELCQNQASLVVQAKQATILEHTKESHATHSCMGAKLTRRPQQRSSACLRFIGGRG